MEKRIIGINHQLQREWKMQYHIESTRTNEGTRKIPMTDDVYMMFNAIIVDSPDDLSEVMIDSYVGFLYIDKDGMPLVALHWKKRINNMVYLPGVDAEHYFLCLQAYVLFQYGTERYDLQDTAVPYGPQ